jgi:serine/threonine-protein kinase HipA
MGLIVFLGTTRVGRLTIDRERKAVVFRFDQSYVEMPNRPVLSRYFEDFELNAGLEFWGEGVHPHSFFRNCLPEGALRNLVESEVPQWVFREYHLLERLGEDLPGNVRLVDDEAELDSDLAEDVILPKKEPPPAGSIRFSLAGFQLKISVMLEDLRITIPVSGLGGKWIAKLPTEEFECLPENEYFMLLWAQEMGIEVPYFNLMKIGCMIDLPAGYQPQGENVLVVSRFDRPGPQRVHQEDFAQVFGLAPLMKYAGEVPEDIHYGSMGRVIRTLCGEKDFTEYVRRIVFMILSGNADAHTKNWSLVYPDGRMPRLSPAYDIVSTVVYKKLRRHIALPLLDETNPYEISYSHWAEFARFCDVDVEKTVEFVKDFSAKARAQWNKLCVSHKIPTAICSAIAEHLRNLLI